MPSLEEILSGLTGSQPPVAFAPTPTQQQADPYEHLRQLLEQANAPEPPTMAPVPNAVSPIGAMFGTLADGLRGALAARGVNLPGEDFATILRGIQARRANAQAANTGATRQYESAKGRGKAAAGAKVELQKIEDKQIKERQAQQDKEQAITLAAHAAQQQAEQDWKAQQEQKDRDLRQHIADSENRLRLQIHTNDLTQVETPDKVASRHMAEEQRKLLQEAKEGVLVVKQEIPARLQRGETKQQIRERFMDQLDAMGLDGDARQAAEAFFELKLGGLLYEDQGPAPQPEQKRSILNYWPQKQP